MLESVMNVVLWVGVGQQRLQPDTERASSAAELTMKF